MAAKKQRLQSLAGSERSRCGVWAGRIASGALVTAILMATLPVPAQEALRNSLTSSAAAEARQQRAESLPYTFKVRDLRVLISPSLRLDWNDNINISRTNSRQDFIVTPTLNVNASYPLTDRNVLTLSVGLGYKAYFENGQYNTLLLHSGTALSFDIYVKDFWINLHDRASYVQDSSQQSAVVGTANYATLNNTAGLDANWDLNKATLSAGYDHLNVISGSRQFNSQDRASEMFFARAGLRVNPKVIAGLESTASFTSYDRRTLNDNSTYSVGAYADWRPGNYFSVKPRIGYTVFKFQQSSTSIQTSDLNSWYADLSISHQPTDAISYSLNAGREIRLGIQSDAIGIWYVRPGIQWRIVKDLGLNTFFSFENGKQGVGNVVGNLTETYDWIGAGFNLSYPVMKKLLLALNYRLTVRSSNTALRDYTQNTIGLLLTYQAR